MSLRVVGAGLPRTGTRSLQLALEELLGGRCYHMSEVFARLGDVPVWRAALRGEPPDWDAFLAGYAAAVDWPASACWWQLAAAHPDALVVLSTRDAAATWWASAEATILPTIRRDPPPEWAEWRELAHELLAAELGQGWADPAVAMAAYERRSAEVRAEVAPERLLEWRPGDGWEPLCSALGLAPPATPFPHVNAREHWAERRDAREVRAEQLAGASSTGATR